jgi:hypothetical protein
MRFRLLAYAFAFVAFACSRVGSQEPSVDSLWADLAANDAARAYRAIGRLAISPDNAVPFLETHLQPVGDSEHLQKRIRELSSDSFATRAAAFADLERSAGVAEMPLQRALR